MTRDLCQKPEEKIPLERSSHGRKDNIIMDLNQIVWEGVAKRILAVSCGYCNEVVFHERPGTSRPAE
jgi:hypothetical protein